MCAACQPTMKIRILFTAILGLVFLSMAQPILRAQATPGMPVVKSIEIQFVGPQTVSKEKILANMRTRVGRAYTPQITEEDIRNLYKTGNIVNVRMFGEAQADGVKVIVVIATKSTISDIVINGASVVKVSALRKQISTKAGNAMSESALEADRQKILDYYRGKGFSDVDVRYRTEGSEKTGTVRVIFDVSEGGKTKIN